MSSDRCCQSMAGGQRQRSCFDRSAQLTAGRRHDHGDRLQGWDPCGTQSIRQWKLTLLPTAGAFEDTSLPSIEVQRSDTRARPTRSSSHASHLTPPVAHDSSRRPNRVPIEHLSERGRSPPSCSQASGTPGRLPRSCSTLPSYSRPHLWYVVAPGRNEVKREDGGANTE